MNRGPARYSQIFHLSALKRIECDAVFRSGDGVEMQRMRQGYNPPQNHQGYGTDRRDESPIPWNAIPDGQIETQLIPNRPEEEDDDLNGKEEDSQNFGELEIDKEGDGCIENQSIKKGIDSIGNENSLFRLWGAAVQDQLT